MLDWLLPVLAALTGGLAAGLQSPLAGLVGQSTHEVVSVFVTYGGGGVVASIILVIYLLTADLDHLSNDTDGSNATKPPYPTSSSNSSNSNVYDDNDDKDDSEEMNTLWENWASIPWYCYLAGPCGLVIVGSVAFSTPRLGAANTTTVFVLSWLVFAAVVDHMGWFQVPQRSLWNPPSRLCGIVILMIGTWLVVRDSDNDDNNHNNANHNDSHVEATQPQGSGTIMSSMGNLGMTGSTETP